MACTRCPRGEDGSVAAACCTEDATGLDDVGAAELPPAHSACRHSLVAGEGSLGTGEGSLGNGEGSLCTGEDSLGIDEDCNDCTEAPGA